MRPSNVRGVGVVVEMLRIYTKYWDNEKFVYVSLLWLECVAYV